ncbi:MAG: hypothetical protein PHE55_11795 [Methylococcaceae bacterium]|nr:hypothetical protein [Methylococcaceae bacterium]
MLKELQELASFVLGFLPWILFLVLPSNGWDALQRSVAICLVASVAIGWKALRKGFVLQWATVAFFLFSAASLYAFKWIWLAENMGIIANSLLTGIIWLTILIGKPFTIELAREEVPQELWHDEKFMSTCRFIAVFWGMLLLVPTAASVFRVFYSQAFPDRFYLYLSLCCIMAGTAFTSFYKRMKRKQREMMSKGHNA